MSEQCPHIVGMSWCEQCAEERIAELEAANEQMQRLIKAVDDRFNGGSIPRITIEYSWWRAEQHAGEDEA